MNTQAVMSSIKLGMLGGVRSMAPMAAMATARGRPAWVRRLLRMGTLTEFALDKVDSTPDRTMILSVAGKTLVGAWLGRNAARAFGQRGTLGAFLGGLSALVALPASFSARKRLQRVFPTAVAGAIEDAFVLALSRRAVNRLPVGRLLTA